MMFLVIEPRVMLLITILKMILLTRLRLLLIHIILRNLGGLKLLIWLMMFLVIEPRVMLLNFTILLLTVNLLLLLHLLGRLVLMTNLIFCSRSSCCKLLYTLCNCFYTIRLLLWWIVWEPLLLLIVPIPLTTGIQCYL